MNARLALLLVAVAISSCGKEPSMSQNANPNQRQQYPTLPEESLRGVARTNLDSPQPTAAQLARKQKNTQLVQAMGLPTLEHLPVVEDETEITPRTAQEVAQRCLAVAIAAVKGETGDQELIEELVKEYGAREYFSPEEKKFIDNPNPSAQDRANFGWRYECAHVLLWSLGYVDKLQPPGEICNVAQEMGVVRDAGPDGLIQNARPRPLSEILDQADLYYRLHWAAIELRLQGKDSGAVDEEIVMERHRALNWLIRYLDQDWDDVTTDT